MGILSGIMGNAKEVEVKDLEKDLSGVIVKGEEVKFAFKVIRDYFVFTTRRLVLVDKQGMTGKKVEYHSLPYKSITHFAVETAGRFDRDSELKIWISGKDDPIVKEFKKGTDIVKLQKALAVFVLR
jgi:hypothetical protein